MKLAPILRGAAAALAITLASTGAMAQAAFSSLKLEFTQPTGTAQSTDVIPIWVKLTNNDAQDFVYDSALPLAGLNSPDLPTSTWVLDPVTQQYDEHVFANYTSFRLSVGVGCSGSFTNNCNDAAYHFEFASSEPFGDPFKLAPGQSFTYLYGTFAPVGGAAPAGTYEFYRSVVWLDVNGVDTQGEEISAVVFPATTCNSDTTADCLAAGNAVFTRTVTAVPEPAQALMLALGLAGLALRLRRRT